MTQQRLSAFFTRGISDDQYQQQVQNINEEHKQTLAQTFADTAERQARKRLREMEQMKQKRGPGRPRKQQTIGTISISNSNANNNSITIIPNGDINIGRVTIGIM